MFTIREELGTLNGLTVTFVGDLKYGPDRTFAGEAASILQHQDQPGGTRCSCDTRRRARVHP